ncbi:hypothetical protein LJR296_007602 [Cupriavidus necator]|uniref:hypothetical protein n=1 Tax=Cupriavidus necator TaxID=106590 RepID=UPI003ED10C6D
MAEPDAYMDKILHGTNAELDAFLTFFLSECPSSMIPTKEEVGRWAEALAARGPEFAADAAACRDFSAGEHT